MPLRLRLIGIRMCKFNDLANGSNDASSLNELDDQTQQPTINRFFTNTSHQRRMEQEEEEWQEGDEEEEEEDDEEETFEDFDIEMGNSGETEPVQKGHKRSHSDPTTEHVKEKEEKKEGEGPPC